MRSQGTHDFVLVTVENRADWGEDHAFAKQVDSGRGRYSRPSWRYRSDDFKLANIRKMFPFTDDCDWFLPVMQDRLVRLWTGTTLIWERAPAPLNRRSSLRLSHPCSPIVDITECGEPVMSEVTDLTRLLLQWCYPRQHGP
jgi:hypothetical protein